MEIDSVVDNSLAHETLIIILILIHTLLYRRKVVTF